MSESKALKQALITAAGYGFYVIPVHGTRSDGTCTCGKPECKSIGKHPVPLEWQKKASNDETVIRQLFAGLNDDYNYGIATGVHSGIFVLDVDGEIGEQSLKELTDKHGKLPITLQSNTGRGRHLFFKYPNKKVHGRASKLAPNLDVRGEGGQIVAPGSRHKSGALYEWDFPGQMVETAPDWLIDLVCGQAAPPVKNTMPTLFNRSTHFDGAMPEWAKDDIQEMLTYINPDDCYDDWYQIGMAIQSYGLPFSVWDDWSKGGAKYEPSEMATKWNSFRGTGISVGTIYHHAKAGGYKPTHKKHIQRPILRAPDVEIVHPVTGEITKEPAPSKRKIELLYADDIQAVTETTDFVEDVLRDNEFSVIYGESNCGKTFFMLDLAMHVALGRQWRDKEVEQGGVIYAALEGGHGTKNRIVAFKEHYRISEKIPFAVIPSNLNFLDSEGDMQSLVDAISAAQERLGRVRLIVIDTLARAIAGGDENSSTDMGHLIINADILRSITGAHISFIHHSGKDALKGARGHSSLRAAVDTEIEISRPDANSPSLIKIVKQREMEMISDMSFGLQPCQIGIDDRNKPVTSCVVVPASVPERVKREVRLNPIQQFLYDCLIEATLSLGQMRTVLPGMPQVDCVYYDELREIMERKGFKEMMATKNKTTAEQVKSATQTARMGLKKAGKINFDNKYVWVVSDEKY